jgi:hypothetical protein
MFTKADNINLVVPRRALEIVFDECDRYDADETGGRILGTYENHRNVLSVAVNGIIEPGPDARRTATYFKQDGGYQEQVFRQVEEREPSIEHLGNWHTHHVNGLRHLSGGDIETYRRTVEHHNHNTDFFYALLVIEKKHGRTDLQRYIFKNYVLRRGDPNIYEIPASALTITDAPLVWPSTPNIPGRKHSTVHGDDDALRTNRVYDRDIVSQFYPKVGTFKSKELGIYWRGPIPLIDGSDLEVVVLEDDSGAAPKYSVTFRNPPDMLARSTEAIGNEWFTSCRAAFVTTERMCNAELYEKQSNMRRRRRWMF